MSNYLEINYENNMKTLSEAIEYSEKKYSHEDIINELALENDLKKQLCLIELNKINSYEEAVILCNNMTGHSGPVRETASYKILELIKDKNYNKYFQQIGIDDIFVKAITDINPSVSRNTVEIIKYSENCEYIYSKITEETEKLLEKINIDESNHSYVQNKKNFSLYWNLEALSSISDRVVPDKRIVNILTITSQSKDYTIREKSAKAVKMYVNRLPELIDIFEVLKNDENMYVRQNFC